MSGAVPYYGDFPEDFTAIRIPFNTFDSNDPTESATVSDLADADIKVHKDGNTTEIATDGASVAIDYDGQTGNHIILIDSSVHSDYSTGSEYQVRVEGVTVDAGNPINAFIGSFSIERAGGVLAILKTINIANGAVEADLTYAMGSILTETAGGRLAAAIIKLFDVATPALTAESVDQGADNNTILSHADYGNAKLVRSTTPANALDVSATGEAGLDFANIKDATGAHTLTNITVPAVTDVTADVKGNVDGTVAGVTPEAAGVVPTAAENVNEWETQSQADPTGFHVNVLEIEGADPTDTIRDSVVDDATRIDASELNTLSGHDPGENIAGVTDVTVIKNTIEGGLVVSDVLEIPEAGNNDFRIELALIGSDNAMEAPDSLPTIDVYNQGGTSRTAALQGDGTDMTIISTGRYYSIYRVDTSHAIEELIFVATVVEGGKTRVVFDTTMVRDDNKTKLDAIYNALITTSPELAGIPAANASMQDKLELLFMALKNVNKTTASQSDIHDDAESSIGSASVTDDGTTLTVGEYS